MIPLPNIDRERVTHLVKNIKSDGTIVAFCGSIMNEENKIDQYVMTYEKCNCPECRRDTP